MRGPMAAEFDVRCIAVADEMRQFLDALPQPLLLLEADERIRFVNRSAEVLLRVPAGELLARQWQEAVALSPIRDADSRTSTVLPDEEPRSMHESGCLLTLPDGSQRVVQVTDTAMPASLPTGRVITLRDCTETWECVRQLKHRCSRDHLTNLVNRREFERRLARVIARARQDGSDNVLVFMDLDCFKSVNDEHGHLAGDHVLQEVAHVLATLVRERDTLARLGGDEFALLMEHCSAPEAVKAGNTLGRLLRRHRFEWRGSALNVGISVGMAVIDHLSGEPEEMLAQADRACYRAKKDTTGKVRLYDPLADRDYWVTGGVHRFDAGGRSSAR